MEKNDEIRDETTLFAGLGLGLLTLAPRSARADLDQTHGLWGEVLKAHVHLKWAGKHRQLHKAIQTHPQTLERYTASLSAVSREQYRAFSKNEKLAFLINAYNAFTVTLVVDHYDDELDSIKDIWFGNEWKRRFFMLLGAKRSLDDVEHELIRENGAFTTFAEPRIHFSVNCASTSCPALLNEPYLASKLDEQLERTAKTFLRDRARNYFDEETGILHLSPILASWYKSDFEKFHTSVPDFVAPLMTDDVALQEKIRSPRVRIKKTEYDWSLNDRSPTD